MEEIGDNRLDEFIDEEEGHIDGWEFVRDTQ